jgi:outer membrane protein OmpA-like peptidoglycan-associated protein
LKELKNILNLALFLLLGGCAGSQNMPGKPNKKAEESLTKSFHAFDLTEYKKAEEYALKAIKINSKFTEAYEMLGKIYQEQKMFDKAIVAYSKAIELDPLRIYARIDLAQIYFDKRVYNDCLEILKPVKEMQGQNRQIMTDVDKLFANASFALTAINNPVPFNPVNLGDKINSAWEEYFPGLTIDEQTLYFTRRDGSLHVYMQNEDLFRADKKQGLWEVAQNIGGPINTPENEAAFTVSADGQYLFFTSCSRPGGVGSCDIWVSKLNGDAWQNPFNLGKAVNSSEWETQPSLTSDGKTLYFVSNRPGGYGGSDIYKSTFGEMGWTTPLNLGSEINTIEDEQFPFIHPDGITLYFTSSGHPGMGKSDIFYSRLTGINKWSKPVNIGYPINTAGEEWNMIVNRTGEKAYYSSNGLIDGFGGMDIYSFDLYDGAKPKSVSYLKGTVYDAKTKVKLAARIQLLDPVSGQIILATNSNSMSGGFIATLQSGVDYVLNVSCKGYLFHSESFFLKETTSDEPFLMDIGLNLIATGEKIISRNIFFDVNKFDLKPESIAELSKLVEFLKYNAELFIEIGGHTDNSGDIADNQKLSENRARSVFDYLVAKGIDKTRMTYKGYGESEPVTENVSESGKAKNRRTEFKIISK